jgi:hypothetical protein
MERKSKRAKRYSTTIKKHNTDDVVKGKIYYINGKGGFSKQDEKQVKVDGISFETYLGLYNDLQETKRNDDLYLNTQNKALTAFLISKGYITPNVDLKALIEDLEELLVIIPNHPYDLLQINGEGYITSQTEISGHIINRLDEYPTDLLYGYYKLVDGELIVDEDKKLEYYGGNL